MSDGTYKLVFNGEVADGKDAAGVKATFAKMFGLGTDEVDVLFSGKRAVLKRGLDGAAARDYSAKLEQIGLVTAVEADADSQAPAAAPPPPAAASEPAPAPVRPASPPPPAPGEVTGTSTGDGGANFYAPPAADLDVAASVSDELVDPRRLPAGRGWAWITDAFRLFAKDWLMWIVGTVIYFVILMVLGIIPVVSIALSILFPIFVGGFMLGAREADGGGNFRIEHVFAGFKNNAGSLAAVGGIYLAGTIAIMIVVALLVGGIAAGSGLFESIAAAESGDPGAMMAGGVVFTVILIALIVLALTLPLLMIVWFSPALVAINGLGAVEAVKLSFRGCTRNILPFLVYGIVLVVLSVAAVLTLGLAYLVLAPVIMASIYTAYREIYLAA